MVLPGPRLSARATRLSLADGVVAARRRLVRMDMAAEVPDLLLGRLFQRLVSQVTPQQYDKRGTEAGDDIFGRLGVLAGEAGDGAVFPGHLAGDEAQQGRADGDDDGPALHQLEQECCAEDHERDG